MAMGKRDGMAARWAGRDTVGGFHPCYLEYFRLFNAQEYYAAHDVLEGLWLESDGELHHFYKALIQLAAGFVHLQHHRREPHHRVHGKRLRPAARLFRRSAELLTNFPASYEGVGIKEIVVIADSSAEALENSDFARNPWHPDPAPQLRGPI